ncbi:MAG TPA: glutaminase A [Methylophilaceae bacterium]|nr:glutaminase A [Methylophilaceae bacterium]HAJ71499.1 glutaminase A [Methylophilaceae bacterium]
MCDDGNVATYIPELSKANPNHFGISMVTVDGQIYEVGDVETLFTIQSISKPFSYGMALEAYGQEKVAQHVGVEPSGDAFNSIVLEKNTNRPFNPMVNAGAITTSALLYEKFGNEAFDVLLSQFSAAAGRSLSIDQAVYESESKTGHRNRAIAHLLLNFGMVHDQVDAALDLYFKQCSIMVHTRDLATMAATLAHVGKNPITKAEVYDIESVKSILSVMFTCGMYDFSGQWAYSVGVPAKSGVSGGIMAVVNRQLGIASYSPKLDDHGNSCRGIAACQDIASELGLHVFDFMNAGSSYLKVMLEQ